MNNSKMSNSPLDIELYLLPKESAKAKTSPKASACFEDLSGIPNESDIPDCVFIVPTTKIASEIFRAGYCHTLVRNKTDAEILLSCECAIGENLSKIFILVEDRGCQLDVNNLIADAFRKKGVPFIPLDISCNDQTHPAIKPGAAKKKNKTALNHVVKLARQYLAFEKQILGKMYNLGWLPLKND